MKRLIPLLASASLMLTGCYAARIVTVSPDVRHQGSYSTTVTIPRTPSVTTTTKVTALSEDISLCLDLQAIGAAFAQSATVQEFERLLNNSSYMLSNLDLNQDGYVDYLRVLETVDGGAHVFVIQAVLYADVYQDVATVVAEVSHISSSCHIQIIGAPYIYGPSFIIEPVFVARPKIYAHLLMPHYSPWHSPWHWGYFPSCYKHPKPIYVNHYKAYIVSYMSHHQYCHAFNYAPTCHYPSYEQVSRGVQRNDWGVSHPERSFSVRNADIPANDNFSSGQTRAANAREIIESVNAAPSSRATTTSSRGTRASSGATTTSSRGTSASSGESKPSSRATTTSPSAGPSSTEARTTVRSTVRPSGSSSTRIRTVSPSGNTSTTSRNTSSASASRSRSSSSAATSAGSATRSTSSATRSSSGSATGSSSSSATRSSSGSATRSSSGSATGSSSSSATRSTSQPARSASGSSSTSSSRTGSRR